MVGLTSLWLPIVVSALFVFVVSSLIHMVLRYHRDDYRKVPSEDGVMDALRKFDIPPGDYVFPYAPTPEAMKNPEYLEKRKKGPVAVLTVIKSEDQGMGSSLAQWFVYCVLVGVFAAYVSGHALPIGAEYGDVFRMAGTTAFCGYSLALLQASIWYKRKWSTTMKVVFDGLIYALVTGGTFGWLWPSV